MDSCDTYIVQLFGKDKTYLRTKPNFNSYYEGCVLENEKVEVVGTTTGPLIENFYLESSKRYIEFFKMKDSSGWIMNWDVEKNAKCLKILSELKPFLVQNCAERYHYETIYLNHSSKVISFRSLDETVRINVYWTTGTVGTCIDHPSQGKTQLFRRNVTLNELETIFRNPRVHTGKGYKFVSDYEEQNRKRTKVSQQEQIAPVNEKQYLKEMLDRLETDKKEIEQKQIVFKAMIQDIEKKETAEKSRQLAISKFKEREEREKKSKEQRARFLSLRGKSFSFNCVENNVPLNENTKLLAFDGSTVLATYDNGENAFSAGLVYDVSKLLRTRSPTHPQPTLIALSPDNNDNYFFIKFSNGKCHWRCHMSVPMDDIYSDITIICFGFTPQKGESYFIQTDDEYYYKNVPGKFEQFVRNNGIPRKASLGSNGEWFIQTHDGINTFGGNVSRVFRRSWAAIGCENIKDVKFGDNYAHIIRF